MLGSRFDLKSKLDDLATRRAGETKDLCEESCVELERAIAVVAKTVHAGSSQVAAPRVAFRCPVCDDVMRVGDESELSEFAGLDVKLHRLQCDTCGMLTGRVYQHSVGYHDRVVR